jgi:hypothetical protein
MNKILLSISTYPRKNNKTPIVFSRMCKTLFQNIPQNLKLEILVIGDDYPNIEKDFKPILDTIKIKYTLVNINQNNALRNMNADKTLKWQHACTRSLIYGFKVSIEKEYDYIITFSDDDYYSPFYFFWINKAIRVSNNADLIYGFGYYCNSIIMPRYYNKILTKNSPTSIDTIASGIIFKSSNKMFIEDIIQLLEKRWIKVLSNLQYEDCPNDALMWNYLKSKFNNNIYRSILIPKIIVYHDTEHSIFNNI